MRVYVYIYICTRGCFIEQIVGKEKAMDVTSYQGLYTDCYCDSRQPAVEAYKHDGHDLGVLILGHEQSLHMSFRQASCK